MYKLQLCLLEYILPSEYQYTASSTSTCTCRLASKKENTSTSFLTILVSVVHCILQHLPSWQHLWLLCHHCVWMLGGKPVSKTHQKHPKTMVFYEPPALSAMQGLCTLRLDFSQAGSNNESLLYQIRPPMFTDHHGGSPISLQLFVYTCVSMFIDIFAGDKSQWNSILQKQ